MKRFLPAIAFAVSALGGIIFPAQNGAAQKIDTVDASGYFVFGKNETIAWVYGIGDKSFIDFFQSTPVEINGKTYIPRIRRYSTGGMDTTYYRQGKEGVHHLNAAALTKGESLTMPSRVHVGQKWFEADSSWSYTVTSTTAQLDTLGDLIVIRAMQVKGDAAQIGRTYDTYYAKGIGMIAGMVEGKILVYLKEIKAPPVEISEPEKK